MISDQLLNLNRIYSPPPMVLYHGVQLCFTVIWNLSLIQMWIQTSFTRRLISCVWFWSGDAQLSTCDQSGPGAESWDLDAGVLPIRASWSRTSRRTWQAPSRAETQTASIQEHAQGGVPAQLPKSTHEGSEALRTRPDLTSRVHQGSSGSSVLCLFSSYFNKWKKLFLTKK